MQTHISCNISTESKRIFQNRSDIIILGFQKNVKIYISMSKTVLIFSYKSIVKYI